MYTYILYWPDLYYTTVISHKMNIFLEDSREFRQPIRSNFYGRKMINKVE